MDTRQNNGSSWQSKNMHRTSDPIRVTHFARSRDTGSFVGAIGSSQAGEFNNQTFIWAAHQTQAA